MRTAHKVLAAAVFILALFCLEKGVPRAQPANDPYRQPAAVEEIRHVRDLLFDGRYDEVVPECRRGE